MCSLIHTLPQFKINYMLVIIIIIIQLFHYFTIIMCL